MCGAVKAAGETLQRLFDVATLNAAEMLFPTCLLRWGAGPRCCIGNVIGATD